MSRPLPRTTFSVIVSAVILLIAAVNWWFEFSTPILSMGTVGIMIGTLLLGIAVIWWRGRETAISLRQQLEAVEQSAAADLKSVIEGAADHNIFSIDRNFRYLHFNSRHESDMGRYFQTQPEIGKSLSTMVPEDVARELKRNFIEAFGGAHLTTTRKLRDRFFNIIFTPILTDGGEVRGLTCNFSDITEKVRIEQQLEEYHENLESIVEERTRELMAQRDFFQKVIDATSNHIFVRDEEGIYVLVNKAASDSFPKEVHDVVGKSVMATEMDEGQARDFMQEDQEILRTGHDCITESIHEDGSGSRKSLYLTKSLLRVNDRKYVLGVHTDITELKHQEEALKTSNQELSSALTKLQDAQAKLIESEKLASLGQLTAGLAHEINNPINYVSGNVSPLMRDFEDLEEILLLILELRSELSETTKGGRLLELMDELEIEVLIFEIKKLLEGIENGTNRVRDLMSSLKNLSRQDDKAPVKMAINKIIRSTLSLIQPSIPHGIELKDHLTRIPMTYGNPGEISQVLLNIIDNALFAMHGAGTLTVSSRMAGDYMEIQISDTGSGISEENMRKIFEPFFTTKEVGEGTGLGLAISHQIINKHGGHLQVSSERDVGTTFTISLPIKKEKPA